MLLLDRDIVNFTTRRYSDNLTKPSLGILKNDTSRFAPIDMASPSTLRAINREEVLSPAQRKFGVNHV